MLRACVLDLKGSWEEHLPLVEFAYNNSYQASIQMAPYEALYGRPCRSPICWTEVGESSITGPDLIRDTSEKVGMIRKRLLTAHSRKKSYANIRRRPLEFEVGDHVTPRIPVRPDWRIRTGFRDARLRTGTHYLIFFLKANWHLWVWPTSYNNSKYYIHITESHLQIQNFTFTIQSTEPTCSEPYKCVGPAVCGCLLMSSPVPTRIKNPC